MARDVPMPGPLVDCGSCYEPVARSVLDACDRNWRPLEWLDSMASAASGKSVVLCETCNFYEKCLWLNTKSGVEARPDANV